MSLLKNKLKHNKLLNVRYRRGRKLVQKSPTDAVEGPVVHSPNHIFQIEAV